MGNSGYGRVCVRQFGVTEVLAAIKTEILTKKNTMEFMRDVIYHADTMPCGQDVMQTRCHEDTMSCRQAVMQANFHADRHALTYRYVPHSALTEVDNHKKVGE